MHAQSANYAINIKNLPSQCTIRRSVIKVLTGTTEYYLAVFIFKSLIHACITKLEDFIPPALSE